MFLFPQYKDMGGTPMLLKYVIRVMSFNLRNAGAADGANAWAHRREFVVETIRAYGPDLLGTQECLAEQGDLLQERLDEYGFFGDCRDDGCRLGEAAAILFRRERFEQLDGGTFWLSETPAMVGSRGWDADLPRICSWVKLGERAGGREMLFANTHFDHMGHRARLESAAQLRRWIGDAGAELPVVLVGDFNADGGSDVHAALLADGLRDAWRVVHPKRLAEEGTFHGFTGDRNRERIDWIAVSPQVEVLGCTIDYTNRARRYPSDHFPITAELRI